MIKGVSIYADEGAGAWGLDGLKSLFGDRGPRLVTAADVIGGKAFENCGLFIMPGGADIPYCRKLDGAGNRTIRAFVESGGVYLGICAGAYYGSASIRFQGSGGEMIAGPRELGFLPGVAEGPLTALAPPYDETLHSAAVTQLVFPDGSQGGAFYFGGPAFTYKESPDIRVHARYAALPGTPPAIVEIAAGKGKAVLSGVHPEASAGHVRAWPARDEKEGARAHILATELEGAECAALMRKLAA